MEAEGKQDEAGLLQAARHLSSRADIALRGGLRVQRLCLGETEGVICDWKAERSSMKDDIRLISYGFAFVLAGTIFDQRHAEAMSEALHEQVMADMSHTEQARETVVEWGLAPDMEKTNPFARTGYKLASRILHRDGALIEELADVLLRKMTMTEDELKAWFTEHAEPLPLEEVEQSLLYE